MTDPTVPRGFATTHWSLVLAAGNDAGSGVRARAALEELCRTYWYPLYAFVRHRGHAPDDAQDLIQSFFARLFETDGLHTADPARGRFRSFLLGALKHFLANEWHRARAQKRGGGETFLELDALDPEARYAVAPAADDDPDAWFDREWARESVARAVAKLGEEARARGSEALFDALAGSLTGAEPDRAQTAERLGLSPGALKVAVHRLRVRFREVLRQGIAETVRDPEEVEDEMRHLLEALRRN